MIQWILQRSGILQNADPNSGVHNDDCHPNSNVNHLRMEEKNGYNFRVKRNKYS